MPPLSTIEDLGRENRRARGRWWAGLAWWLGCTAAGAAPDAPLFTVPAPAGGNASVGPVYAGNESCRSCHADKVTTYHRTAHAQTSQPATPATIRGRFTAGSNTLRTVNPDLYFLMEAKPEGLFQTAIARTSPTQAMTRSEQFALVVGSGRKGQTYLYWDGDRLYQQPVSYWTEQDAWVNSPGYVDGLADFDRPILRRCLECHATSFEPRVAPGNSYLKASLVLGITCEKCHGPGGEHIARYRSPTPPRSRAEAAILNPAKLARERQIDLCSLCHAGAGDALTPPLSFHPGDALASHLTFPKQAPGEHIDVHASQVQLFEQSRCFQSSPAMTCTTCHDVHQPQRDAAAFAARCLQCHQIENCGEFARQGRVISNQCVGCHMPLEQTEKIVIAGRNSGSMQPRVRNHRIAVYPNARRP